MFAVPFSVAAAAAADADHSTLAVWLTLGAIVGFVLGAGCAAWTQRAGTPLTHGIVAATATYLAAQAVFVLVRLVRGSDVHWFAIFFNLSVVAVAGLLGGVLGQRLRQRGSCPPRTTRRDREQRVARSTAPVSTVLVIDVGTTSLRAAIVDDTLAIVDIERRAIPPTRLPGPGRVRRRSGGGRGDRRGPGGAARAAGPVAAVGIANQRASTDGVGSGDRRRRSARRSAGRTCAR